MADIWLDVDAAVEVPVNVLPLIDDTDFKTVEDALAYDAAGMDIRWNFITTAGVQTSTAVTPTTAGVYDWTHKGDGIYTLEIPASGGASANNDTEGFGWISGKITGVLPFRGPVIGFRAAGLNNVLIDSAYSATRGLAGTALPDAAADAAGGLPISDAGALDLDAKIGALTFTVAGDVDVNVQSWAGSAVATPTTAGVPEVDVTYVGGSAATAASAPTAADIADAVCDEALAGHATAGTLGATLAATATATALSTVEGKIDTVDGNVDAILVDVATTIPTQISNLNDPTAAAIADAVWDEVITGAEHNVSTSAAKFLREGSLAVALTGTAQAGAATTITLAAGASASDDIYNWEKVEIIEGTGEGQSRLITDYNGTTKVATVGRAWTVNPDATSVYAIMGADAEVSSISQSITAADNVEANIGNLDAAISTVDTVVDAIKAVTDLLPDGGALSSLATAAALATVDENVDQVLLDTGVTLPAYMDSTVAQQTTLADVQADVANARDDISVVDGVVDAILVHTGTTIPGTLSTGVAVSSLTSAAITDVWSTDTLTEAYAAAGAEGTPAEILYMIQQMLNECLISGTTMTVKKLDGSTTAATFTLNSSTAPTSRTRAS